MVLVVVAVTACAQDASIRVRYGYILPVNKELFVGNPNWEQWKPTEENVEIVDALLSQELKARRKEFGIKKPCRYKRQYAGYINESGERIVWVNGICGSRHNDKIQSEPVIVFGGGSCYWNAHVSLEKLTVIALGSNSLVVQPSKRR
jgi:hypothetical protein